MASYKTSPEVEFPSDCGIVIDYAHGNRDDFRLIALLTSTGDLLVYTYNHDNGIPRIARYRLNELTFSDCSSPVLVCVSDDLESMAIIESNGAILLLPGHYYLDNDHDHDDNRRRGECFQFLIDEIDTDDITSTPTCAIWYSRLTGNGNDGNGNSEMLIISVKNGNIFFVNVKMRTTTILIQAPQSITVLQLFRSHGDTVPQLFRSHGDATLSVTGFTGAQWLIPLGIGDQTLRETLHNLCPAHFRQIEPVGATVLNLDDGDKFALLIPEEGTIQIFDSLALQKPIDQMKIPENTCLVQLTRLALATVDQNGRMHIKYRFLDFDTETIECQQEIGQVFTLIALNGEEQLTKLPEFILATSNGLFRVHPNSTLEQMICADLMRHPENVNSEFFDQLEKHFNCSRDTIGGRLVEFALQNEYPVQLAIDIALNYLVGIMDKFNLTDRLFKYTVMDSMREWMIRFYIEKIQLDPKIETELCKYLEAGGNNNFSRGSITALLANGLWCSIGVILRRNLTCHEQIVQFLSAGEGVPDVFQLVQIMTMVNWTDIGAKLADELFDRLLPMVPNMNTVEQLSSLARITFPYIERSSAALKLNTLCNLRIEYGIVSESTDEQFNCSNRPNPPIPQTFIACGANASMVLNGRVSMYFWGQLKSHQRNSTPTIVPSAQGSPNKTSIKTIRKSPSKSTGESLKTSYGLFKSSQPMPIQLPNRIVSVSAGAEHVHLLTDNGNLFTWGANRFGQCGMGHRRRISSPHMLTAIENVSIVSAGVYHSGAITISGEVFMWGWNLHSQLGLYDTIGVEDSLIPVQLEFPNDTVINLACGYSHSVFLTKSGRLFACGNSNYGQLGRGTMEKRQTPTEITGICDRVSLIATKYFHTVILTQTGQLFTWGATPQALKFKALLAKKRKSMAKAASIESNSTVEVKAEEANFGFGIEHLSPRRLTIPGEAKVAKLSCGLSHSALVTSQGDLYTWGKSLEMQLGQGDKKERAEPSQVRLREQQNQPIWHAVCCGLEHTLAMTTTGEIYAWGRNDMCQLGIESKPSPLEGRILSLKGSHGPRTIRLPAAATSLIGEPMKVPGVNGPVVIDHHQNLSPEKLLQNFRKSCSSDFATICGQMQLPNGIKALGFLYAGQLKQALEFVDYGNEKQMSLLMPMLFNVKLHDKAVKQGLMAEVFNRTGLAIVKDTVSDELWKPMIFELLITGAQLSGITPQEKLALIREMANSPPPSNNSTMERNSTTVPNSIDIELSTVQNFTDPVRFFTGCRHMEKISSITPKSTSSPSQSSTWCSKCIAQWRNNVKL